MRTLTAILILFCCLGPGLTAQSGIIYYTDSQAVQLRWAGVHVPLPQGYTVFRKTESSTTWEKLNRKLLKPEWKFKDLEKLLGYRTAAYLSLFGLDYLKKEDINTVSWDSVFSKKDADAFIGALSMVNPQYAEALGEKYTDNDILPGTRYVYRITCTKQNGEEYTIGETIPFTAGEGNKPPMVHNFSVTPSDKGAIATWDRQSELLKKGEIVTWNLAMSEDPLGPFVAVNFYGILPISAVQGKSQSEISYHIQFLENQRTYYFKVAAVDAFGNTGKWSPLVTCVPGDPNTLHPPTGLRIAGYLGRARINWDSANVVLYRQRGNENFQRVYPPEGISQSASKEWVDFEIEPGISYAYFLRTTDAAGNFSSPGDTAYYTPADSKAPAAPVGLNVTVERSLMKLRWSKNTESDLLGYDIERSSDPGHLYWFKLNNKPVSKTIFTDSLNEKSTTVFSYRLIALDLSYNESEPSEPVLAHFPDRDPPSAPLITFLQETDSGVLIRWTAGPETDIETYTVYFTADPAKSPEIAIRDLSKPSGLHKPNISGVRYYSVSATDTAGNEGLKANYQKITLSGPVYLPSPANGGIDTVGKGLLIHWTPVSSDRTAGYVITRIHNGKSLDIGGTDARTTDYKDLYPPKGDLQYEIRARNKDWQMGKPLILNIRFH